jgi:myo-inositol-1(or 4)-monophosphatase
METDGTFLESALRLAEKAARDAGLLLMDHFQKNVKVEFKGEINPVTEADYLSQEKIISIISSKYPDHGILAEEGDDGDQVETEYQWIIDPLDGTVNYSHNYPFFCVSIALKRERDVVLGAVYNPVMDEMFTALKGQGAHLNGSPIKASDCKHINRALLCTGFPYDVKQSDENNIAHFTNFIMAAQAIRRDGTAALDLCYVAAGRFDGFWELKLYPWDMAAGGLMVLEAGGMVTDFKGGEFNPFSRDIVASNGPIHEEMLSIISKGMD